MIFFYRNKLFFFVLGVLTLINYSCSKNKGRPSYEGYPEKVGEIIVNKCAVSGCHNSISADDCVGLDLSSWSALFEGGRNNSAVIPYRSDQSFLFFSVNTFNDLGPKLSPTMPFNIPPLTREELLTIRDWINNGAPNNENEVKFSDYNKSKIYISNQGCDIVTVFDAQSKLIERVVDVGNSLQTEAPHDMMVAPDGNYFYVSFYASNVFQKFKTSNNSKVGEITLSEYSWHSIDISGDSRICITTHLAGNGAATLIDLENMKIIATYKGANFLVYPHGCALNYNGSVVYITSQQGDFLYKINISDPQNPDVTEIPLQTGQPTSTNGIYKPYTVKFFPDYSKYAVTCQGTNELRIFNTANDSLISTMATSGVPQVMSFSQKNPYLFVSCMEDSSNVQTQGKVDIINY
ncbi:MAG: hypothetical protein IT235_02690, partial [Bacteroidia bacterium]|nr:hypothetical protein [Bacteroidia bacterium]